MFPSNWICNASQTDFQRKTENNIVHNCPTYTTDYIYSWIWIYILNSKGTPSPTTFRLHTFTNVCPITQIAYTEQCKLGRNCRPLRSEPQHTQKIKKTNHIYRYNSARHHICNLNTLFARALFVNLYIYSLYIYIYSATHSTSWVPLGSHSHHHHRHIERDPHWRPLFAYAHARNLACNFWITQTSDVSTNFTTLFFIWCLSYMLVRPYFVLITTQGEDHTPRVWSDF